LQIAIAVAVGVTANALTAIIPAGASPSLATAIVSACPPARSVGWRQQRGVRPRPLPISAQTIAFGPGGRALAVWGTHRGIRGAVRRAAGQAWQRFAFRGNRFPLGVSATYDASGRALVAWWTDHKKPTGPEVVAVNPSGSVGSARRLPAPATSISGYAVAMNARGDAVLAGSERHVVRASFRSAGGAFDSEQVVVRHGRGTVVGHVAIAIAPNGTVTAAWQEGAAGGHRLSIVTAVRGRNGKWSDRQTVMTSSGPTRGLGDPVLGVDRSGAVEAAFLQRVGALWRVALAISKPGRPFGESSLSSSPEARVSAHVPPALAVAANGDVIAAWMEGGRSGGSVMTATGDTAQGLGAPYAVGSVSSVVPDPLLLATTPDGRAALAWVDHCGRAAGRRLIVATRAAGPRFDVPRVASGADTSIHGPTLGIDRDGETVAWMHRARFSNGGPIEIARHNHR
jgi:hypothetical protein